MKCKLIRPMQAFNPDYDREDAAKAKQEGTAYDVPQIITREPGHIQDHPESWKHCVRGYMNSDPNAVPADEECRDKVREWLKNRPNQIKRLAAFLESKPVGAKAKAYYDDLKAAYRDELYELNPDKYPLQGEDDADVSEEDEDD